MTTVAPGQCMSCQSDLTGPYCAHCGEVAHAHDYSLTHFLHELLETTAHVDGRVFASFRALLTQPGQLALDFLAGRRKAQMGPVQLFLVCNVIYFLMLPFTLFATFTTTLGIHINGGYWWGRLAYEMASAHITAHHLTWQEYTREFNETAHLQGHTLLILIVPGFALGLWALYGRTRRFYAEHLVLAFYTWAFGLLWLGASTIAISVGYKWAYVHGWRLSGTILEIGSDVLIGGVFALYLSIAARRLYRESWLMCAWKSAVAVVWLNLVMDAYKFVLFFTTFYRT